MKHSIVIPVYNKASYISDTIASLAQQSKKPDELIFVDDCSTDNSLDVMRKTLTEFEKQFKQTEIKIIELSENKGPGHARNTGLNEAQCELISFLDADDIYLPETLFKISENMTAEHIDLLVLGIRMKVENASYPKIESFKEELIRLSEKLYLLPLALHTVTSPDFIMGVGSNVAIKRAYLKEIRYDSGALLNEGIDFWYRVLKHMQHFPESRIALLPEDCIEVREVEGSLSRKSYSRWKELEIPLPMIRYRKSKDKNDRLLFCMIGQRWHEHAMERLPGVLQKTLFHLGNSRILLKMWYIRKLSNLN